MNAPQIPNLTASDLLTVLRVSRTGLWRLRQLPDFPHPFTLTARRRKLMWNAAEVEAWQQANKIVPSLGEPAPLRTGRIRHQAQHQQTAHAK